MSTELNPQIITYVGEYPVRPITPSREVLNLRQCAEANGLRLIIFGDFACMVLPSETGEKQHPVSAFTFIDLDDTLVMSSTLTHAIAPELYDAARVAPRADKRATVFDPGAAAALRDQTVRLREAKRVGRRALARGMLTIRKPVGAERIPRLYPYAEDLCDIIRTETHAAPVILTCGAYLTQMEKALPLLIKGDVTGALITKIDKAHSLERLLRNPTHPLTRILMGIGLADVRRILLVGENDRDLAAMMDPCKAHDYDPCGILLTSLDAWYSKQRMSHPHTLPEGIKEVHTDAPEFLQTLRHTIKGLVFSTQIL